MTVSLSISASDWKPLDAMSTISDQKVYLIISHYLNKFYYMRNDLYRNGVYGSKADADPHDDFNMYFTFQLKNAGNGYWNLYNVCRGSYVNATYYSPINLIDKPDGEEPTKWTIDDKYIRSHLSDDNNPVLVLRGRDYYSMMSESVIKKATHAKPYDYLFPSIYELSTLTIDENTDFPSYMSSFNVEKVVLNRTFIENVKNTLVLPFDVPNYKDVFGSEVTAYEYSNINGNLITFEAVNSDDLKANTPYIIKGASFNPSPYNIDAKTIYPANSGKTDNSFIYVVYRSSQAKNGYMLTKDGLKKCHESNEKPFIIAPYRWYFNSDMPNAKLNLISNSTSSISEIRKNCNINKVFDMQGRIVSNDSNNLESLPKGIYIVAGKKFIKH